MNRAILSVRLALEALLGVLILLNAPFKLIRLMQTGPLSEWIGAAVATLIGIALVADAVRVRRRLKTLDAIVDEQE